MIDNNAFSVTNELSVDTATRRDIYRVHNTNSKPTLKSGAVSKMVPGKFQLL